MAASFDVKRKHREDATVRSGCSPVTVTIQQYFSSPASYLLPSQLNTTRQKELSRSARTEPYEKATRMRTDTMRTQSS